MFRSELVIPPWHPVFLLIGPLDTCLSPARVKRCVCERVPVRVCECPVSRRRIDRSSAEGEEEGETRIEKSVTLND